ncbi:MAG: hypothetical protein AB8B85_02070 [Paracoccaceae bacterium]
MRRTLALLALGLLAACAPQKKAQVEADLSKQLSPGCYTVDLFDPYRLEYPEAGVSPKDLGFLGVWQNGAWDGDWCHDLYITRVSADGSVELLDAYGPSARFGHEATVYRRKGRISDGVLTFISHKQTPVSYRLVGDYLVGQRKGLFGVIDITMSRTDRVAVVPVPPRKPVRS